MASWNKITAGDTLYDVRRSGSKREYWPVKVVSMDSVTETAMCQWNHNPARQYTRRQLEKLHVKRPGASTATTRVALLDDDRCTAHIKGRRCGRRVADYGTRRCRWHPHTEDVSDEILVELRQVFADGGDVEPEHFWYVVRVLDEVERRRKQDKADKLDLTPESCEAHGRPYCECDK